MKSIKKFSAEEISKIIEMAWEEKTPFEIIEYQFGLSESDTVSMMRAHMQPGSFRLWRERVTDRKMKHLKLRSPEVSKAYSSRHSKV